MSNSWTPRLTRLFSSVIDSWAAAQHLLMATTLSLNRGRLIIGERPAEDAVQCLRCRRRWEANMTGAEMMSCAYCRTAWEEPPEWDRSCIMRRVHLIEMRWRDGFTFGPWHFAEMVPATVDAEKLAAT